MKIALLPGGFKPPHLGHYNMAKYLADFADNVIVRVGPKERDGIGKELALEIWNFYKEFDPDPRSQKLTVSVAQSPSPVKDVYDFIEQIAPEGSTVILGVGEKDAQDGRYNAIPKFAEPRNITAEIELVPPQAGGISGTRMREIIKANDKEEFFKYIPTYLPEEIKEEIWTKLIDTTMPTDIEEMMGGTMNREEMAKHNKNMQKLRRMLNKTTDQMVQVPSKLTKGLRRKLYEDIDHEELKKGIEVEKEHTNDPRIAMKIALDHLAEDPKYYTKLATLGLEEMKLFSQEWWLDIITEEILNEGGAAGHMAHPFDLPNVKTGQDLIKVFEQSADSLKTTPGSVKIDGVNASIRLINLDGKKEFAMDRGSKKELDVTGVTKDKLEDRFGQGHGMIKAGGAVLDIFNDALPSIQEELKALGLFDNPNVMFNMEYVSGKSNVQDYGKNFLAIHGLLEVETKEVQGARQMLTKRIAKEKRYAESDMNELLKKLEPFAKKKGFEIYGSVPTEFKQEPNFKKALNTKYKIEFAEGAEVKTLAQWLGEVTDIPKDNRLKMNLETGGTKDVGALSKQVYFAVFGGETIDDLFDSEQDIQTAIQGATTYLATEKLGDAILDVLDSPMGSVNNHEGVVIRDEKISPRPFKITGKFITGGVESQFRTK